MTCLVLVVDVYLKDENRNVSYVLAQFGLIITLLFLLMTDSTERVIAFNGHFVNDAMASLLKIFIVAIVAIVFVYSRDYLKQRGIFKGEFYVLGLFATLGMMIMVSAHSLLSLYLGLELLSLSLYAMVAFNRDNNQASEAAMKYFVLGAIASGMLLYGMSMIYGATGAIEISQIAATINEQKQNSMVLIFGLVFLVVGMAFKLGAVPFHMWIPDVYQGAPTTVTSFISTAPKIAGFAMMNLLWVSIALYTGADEGEFRKMFEWIGFALATPTLFYSGWPFLKGAWTGIKQLHLGMDLPIAIGASTTYSYSIYVMLSQSQVGDVYFDTVVNFIFVILVGRFLEAKSKRHAISATQRLLDLQPRVAHVIRDGESQAVPIRSVKSGEIVLIKAGDRKSVV